MARLLAEGDRYDGLGSTALLENEFERLVVANAEGLFPGFIVVPFNMLVSYDGVFKRADLAIIDEDYRSWWVGEVELGHHSLRDHVRPQIEVLARAQYGREAADWISTRNPTLDSGALTAMMLGSQPRVAVIVNVPRPEWVDAFRPYGAVLMIVEVFRSAMNRVILRQNGDTIEGLGNVISECRLDPVIPRLLTVSSPAQLLTSGITADPVEIEFGGALTEWTLIQAGDRVWLSPVRGTPFPQGAGAFTLVRTADGRLAFRSGGLPRN